MDNLEDIDILVPIVVTTGICVVLPIMITWLVYRFKTLETNRRTEIILSALEKNSDVDVEDLMKKLSPQKTKEEKQNSLLLRGCILSFIGLGILSFTIWNAFDEKSLDSVAPGSFFFIAFLGAGLSYLMVYRKCKREA